MNSTLFDAMLKQYDAALKTLTPDQSAQAMAFTLAVFETRMWDAAAGRADVRPDIMRHVDLQVTELEAVLSFQQSPLVKLGAVLRLTRNVYKEALSTIRHEYIQEGLFDRCQL